MSTPMNAADCAAMLADARANILVLQHENRALREDFRKVHAALLPKDREIAQLTAKLKLREEVHARELAALRASHERLAQANDLLYLEVEALRRDKTRLDWLEKAKCAYYHEGPCCWRINEDDATDNEFIRAAIDAAAGFKPSNDGQGQSTETKHN